MATAPGFGPVRCAYGVAVVVALLVFLAPITAQAQAHSGFNNAAPMSGLRGPASTQPSQGLVPLSPYNPGPTEGPREGFFIGVGLGLSVLWGLGIDEVRGLGGGIFLRLGTRASHRLSWLLQLEYAGEPETIADAEQNTVERFNTFALLGRYRVRDVFWVQAGPGISNVLLGVDPATNQASDDSSFGIAVASAAGYDFARAGSVVVAAEVGLSIGLHEGGMVTNTALRFSASWM